MTGVNIRPGPAVGTLRAPPSKSYTHRALIVGFLAGREFRIRNPLDAEDTRATADALQRLGARVRRGRAEWVVSPSARTSPRGTVRIDCGESGTTLRFVTALAGLLDRTVEIDGSPRLGERPIDELVSAVRQLGVTAEHVRDAGLPLRVHGPAEGGSVTLDASQSSQFVSALLLALPALKRSSILRLKGDSVSRPYVEATLAVLRHCGVRVSESGRTFRIAGGQRFRGDRFEVPGDASSAAYLWSAAAMSEGRVRVEGVPVDWPQADLAILDLLVRAGARVARDARGVTVEAGERTPFSIDLSDSPDLYPLAGVLAATTPGRSELRGAAHVALKESDRRSGTVSLARALGARVESRRGHLVVHGVDRPRAVRLPRLTDHRMVMSAAVAALSARGTSRVGERSAVSKSYPKFWDDLARLTDGVR